MSKKDRKRYEVDLYEPIQNYFTAQGYTVHGEVNDCDVAAVKDDILIIIELKLTLNIDLLIQATKRQRYTEFVYVAIPHPTYSLRSRKWQDICHLMRRLELGLITVSFQEDRAEIKVIHEPVPFDKTKSMRQSKRRRNNILTEIEGRQVSTNIGGSHQTRIHTAYKETCIHIACCLERFGPLSPKLLREMGTGEKTYTILHKNYDGWFEKIERGIYTITEKGLREYKENQEIVDFYEKLLPNMPS